MDTIDKKIENALQDNNIVKIMNKASASFQRELDSDIIYNCQLYALWKSFLNYKPEKNTKFTTYLYNGVFIECLKNLKFQQKHQKKCVSKLHDNISDEQNNALFELLDLLDDDQEKELILDKYKNLTIKEMADKRNSNRETVRKKLIQVYSKIRKKTQ